MHKVIFFLTVVTLLVNPCLSQIQVDRNDMPNIGDTIRISITNNLQGADPSLTGANFLWNFATLVPNSQTVDTFLNILSTPVTYNVVFNDPIFDPTHKATIALRDYNNANPIPNIQISEIFNFYQESNSKYVQVGMGAKINGVSTPIKYDIPELIYSFPLQMDDTDSTTTNWGTNIPTIGYYGQRIKRVNTTDGWGVLITPLDTFNVFRTKSLIYISDTIYYSNFMNGVRISRPLTTEYRWITDNIGEPVLQISKQSLTSTIRYRDIAESMNPSSIKTFSPEQIAIFPNPVKQKLHIYSNNNIIKQVNIYNIAGLLVKSYNSNFKEIDLSEVAPGLYFVCLLDEEGLCVRSEKLVKD